MLKVAANPSFWAEVEISVPGQDKPHPIQIQFKHLPKDPATELIERARTPVELDEIDLEASEELGEEVKKSRMPSDYEVCSEIVLDWKGLDQPFSPEALQEFLQSYSAAGLEIFRRWMEELGGSKVKNSKPPRNR